MPYPASHDKSQLSNPASSIEAVQHLRAVLAEYQVHYNGARPHQGIAQRVPDTRHDTPPPAMTDLDIKRIRRKPILSGLINEYAHAA